MPTSGHQVQIARLQETNMTERDTYQSRAELAYSAGPSTYPEDAAQRQSPTSLAYDRPRSGERHRTMLTAPSLSRRATDMDGHPYHRPMQSEIVPTRYGGYSSHNPTHIMQSVESSSTKSNKTRRREAWQIDILEAFYRHKHMPDKSEKEMLAARINDTLKYVNIWFQNRRQAAQKKGELRPRETYENWRTRRRGGSYDGFPTPPEHTMMASSASYFGRSYPPPMMHPLITPGEEDRRLSPPNMQVSPNATTSSPFAFPLALPLRTAYEAPRHPQEYERMYERSIYTPPYSSGGPPFARAPVCPGELPPIERSATMRREVPAPTFGGFSAERRRSLDRKLPAMPMLEAPNSGSTASSALPSPRKESLTSEASSNGQVPSSFPERSPPSDLKLPPITSLLPDDVSDHIAWTSAMRNRRL
ncbi:hypothetical protein NliqN6_0078 [Naganishia liquefaciens]|uniref:Homeobox domain-containing protein n=1 Tax=Naganishia liquefaciens TaxID=104408 RepID=A0A8H3TMZ3_9TREE|nr:hypothetical protein NliqN6_0078 [Naganishia liquefaciens]